jgi:hypothetical protein
MNNIAWRFETRRCGGSGIHNLLNAGHIIYWKNIPQLMQAKAPILAALRDLWD